MAGVKLDVTFNGESLSEKYGIDLISYDIQSAASRKTKGIDIPGRDGTYRVKSAFTSKDIVLSVVVQDTTADKVHAKIRTFLSWLSQQEEPHVTFTDNPEVFVKADLDYASEYHVIRGIDNALAYLTINLYQYDPFSYEAGVMSYEWECIPGETYDILNEGMYTPYVIKISGTGSAMTAFMATSIGHSTLVAETGEPLTSNIQLTVNGVTQMYAGTLSTTDVLEIDSGALTVKKNGVSTITKWDGDMKDLVYGMNTISLKNTENASLHVVFEFYRRWL